MFDAYLVRWGLVPDGDPIVTRAARLLPVRHQGKAAMLRVAILEEAKGGEVLLRWWDGKGAARVLASDGDALLLERAEGTRSLVAYARNGRDDEATQIICDVVAELHAPRAKPLPDLIPLERGFDHANLFCNPDLSDPSPPVAIRHERFLRRLEIVVERAGIERQRLLAWILAWAGLSAAWFLGDGESAEVDLCVAKVAEAELAR